MIKSIKNTDRLSKKLVLLLGGILIYSFSVSAAITPYIVETRTLYFGHIVFMQGSCSMAYDSQVISNLTTSNICTSSTGTTGTYQIFSNPNTQVQIKLKSHGDNGNGIIYVPNGELVSDFETALIIADTTKTINSGASGIINITIGGRLTISSTLASSASYDELFEIEFIEL